MAEITNSAPPPPPGVSEAERVKREIEERKKKQVANAAAAQREEAGQPSRTDGRLLFDVRTAENVKVGGRLTTYFTEKDFELVYFRVDQAIRIVSIVQPDFEVWVPVSHVVHYSAKRSQSSN